MDVETRVKQRLEFLAQNVGRAGTIRVPALNYYPDGVIIERPQTEDRTDFVFAYQSDVPCYKKGSESPVGNSIMYFLLRPQFIFDMHENKDGIISINSEDPHAQNGGGIYTREDLEKIAKYFPNLNVNSQAGSFVNASDLLSLS